MAGPAGTLRTVGNGLQATSPLVGGRYVGNAAGTGAGDRERRGQDRLGCVGGLHHGPGSSACRRRPQNRPAGDCSSKGAPQRHKFRATRRFGAVRPPGGGGEAGECLGRSRGGFTTKIHLAADGRCRPLSIVVTAGQRGDSPQFEAVMNKICVPCIGPGRPRTRPDSVSADKAYSSRSNRRYLRRRKIRHTIPEPEMLSRSFPGRSRVTRLRSCRPQPYRDTGGTELEPCPRHRYVG